MDKEMIAKIRRILKRILKKNGVTKAAVFGSYARGEEKNRSDIDILAELPGRNVCKTVSFGRFFVSHRQQIAGALIIDF